MSREIGNLPSAAILIILVFCVIIRKTPEGIVLENLPKSHQRGFVLRILPLGPCEGFHEETEIHCFVHHPPHWRPKAVGPEIF